MKFYFKWSMFFKIIIPAAEKKTGRKHLNRQYSLAVPVLYLHLYSVLSYSAAAPMTTMDFCCGKEYKRTTIQLGFLLPCF